MKILIKNILVIVALLSLPAFAYGDGSHLLEQCVEVEKLLDKKEVKDLAGANYCLGFVLGVRSTMRIFLEASESDKVCFPESGINNGQATRIVLSYLRKNPMTLHKDEVLLTIRAFAEAYPCKT